MSSDGNGAGPNGEQPNRQRRSSITQAAMSNLFQRGSSSGAPPTANDTRRRLSVTTLGLSGTQQSTSPSFNLRRGSMSTNSNSDSIDESAIEEDDGQAGAKTAPTTPFVRRMSFGAPAMRGGYRAGGSSGNGNDPAPTSPPPSGRRHSGQRSPPAQGSSITAALSAAGRRSSLMSSSLPQASTFKHPRAPSDNVAPRSEQQGFNWSEQLRSRAESSVSGARPSFSLASSPPRGSMHHDRAKSVSDMPQPPTQAPAPKPQPERRKPDAFQERILKGDFYMD
ncbi:hypothetical protein LIA77_01254 [Sarocladium implicatum]|nr:hypothetical protein LIA77_01254 [Sarocladium implicatum]